MIFFIFPICWKSTRILFASKNASFPKKYHFIEVGIRNFYHSMECRLNGERLPCLVLLLTGINFEPHELEKSCISCSMSDIFEAQTAPKMSLKCARMETEEVLNFGIKWPSTLPIVVFTNGTISTRNECQFETGLFVSRNAIKFGPPSVGKGFWIHCSSSDQQKNTDLERGCVNPKILVQFGLSVPPLWLASLNPKRILERRHFFLFYHSLVIKSCNGFREQRWKVTEQVQ